MLQSEANDKVWTALVGVNQYVRKGIVDQLESGLQSFGGADAKPIFDGYQAFEVARPFVSVELRAAVEDAFRTLEKGFNQVLDSLRAVVALPETERDALLGSVNAALSEMQTSYQSRLETISNMIKSDKEALQAERAGAQGITQNITVNGSIVGSNVVAARTIENSSLMAAQTPMNEDLRVLVSELHKAVAELTESLDDDEAALAARDLEDLTKEITSPTPRAAFWRRAIEGLTSAAETAAEVGGPVVTLLGKIAVLMG